MSFGTTLLARAQVMDGVAEMIPEIQVEATKSLVTVRRDILSDRTNDAFRRSRLSSALNYPLEELGHLIGKFPLEIPVEKTSASL
jgi:hypothetical protein